MPSALCVDRYDDVCADVNSEKFEGVTNLVEHPIQMKPPGEMEYQCLLLWCSMFVKFAYVG